MRETTEPLDLCVLIPCFNNLPGLISSLQSIKYHPGKLMVLVVDDGSAVRITVDTLLPHLDSALALQVVNLETNSGITKALNTGLKWISDHILVKYIARLDCADLCHEGRFYEQVKYLESHTEVGLVGSWCMFINPKTNHCYTYSTPETHKSILKEMHFRNVFIHPTVIFRSELVSLIGYYPDDYPHVEDYVFFWRAAKCSKTAVLPQVLVTCEINEKGISIKNRRGQLIGRQKVVTEFGTHLHLKIVGLLKLKLLSLIPYQFILKIKSQIRN